jgi:hypothetical protein
VAKCFRKEKKEKGEQPNLCLRKQNQPTHSILVKKRIKFPVCESSNTGHTTLFCFSKKKGADRRFHSCHTHIRHTSHASNKANCKRQHYTVHATPVSHTLRSPAAWYSHALGTGPFPSRDSYSAAGGNQRTRGHPERIRTTRERWVEARQT